MKKFLLSLAVGAVIASTSVASHAAVLFDYWVNVNGGPADLATPSGGNASGSVTLISPFPFFAPQTGVDATPPGSDIDVLSTLANPNAPPNTASTFNGTAGHGLYALDIHITDEASGLSGDWFVTGKLTGSYTFNPVSPKQFLFANSFLPGLGPNDQPPLLLGVNKYFLSFTSVDLPAPDGTVTFHVTSTPEPGPLALVFGAGLTSSLVAFRRRRK